jgi:hypothetical protein
MKLSCVWMTCLFVIWREHCNMAGRLGMRHEKANGRFRIFRRTYLKMVSSFKQIAHVAGFEHTWRFLRLRPYLCARCWWPTYFEAWESSSTIWYGGGAGSRPSWCLAPLDSVCDPHMAGTTLPTLQDLWHSLVNTLTHSGNWTYHNTLKYDPHSTQLLLPYLVISGMSL